MRLFGLKPGERKAHLANSRQLAANERFLRKLGEYGENRRLTGGGCSRSRTLLLDPNSLLTGKNAGNFLIGSKRFGDNCRAQNALAKKTGFLRPIGIGSDQGMNRESEFPDDLRLGENDIGDNVIVDLYTDLLSQLAVSIS